MKIFSKYKLYRHKRFISATIIILFIAFVQNGAFCQDTISEIDNNDFIKITATVIKSRHHSVSIETEDGFYHYGPGISLISITTPLAMKGIKVLIRHDLKSKFTKEWETKGGEVTFLIERNSISDITTNTNNRIVLSNKNIDLINN